MEIPKLVTISEAAELSKQLCIGITKNHIRNLAKSGEIKCLMAGSKTLIVWNSFLEYIGSPPDHPKTVTPGIRPIPERWIS